MARWNLVLSGITMSALLLSGCLVEALPEDGVSWARDDGSLDEDFDRRPESIFGARSGDDPSEQSAAPTSGDTESKEPLPPPIPQGEEAEVNERQEQVPTEDLANDSLIDRFDPQPDPRVTIKIQ